MEILNVEIEGNFLFVSLSNEEIVKLEITKTKKGKAIFHDLIFGFADTDLKRLIKKIVKWEIQYGNLMKQEQSLWQHHVDDDPNEDISIPSWL